MTKHRIACQLPNQSRFLVTHPVVRCWRDCADRRSKNKTAPSCSRNRSPSNSGSEKRGSKFHGQLVQLLGELLGEAAVSRHRSAWQEPRIEMQWTCFSITVVTTNDRVAMQVTAAVSTLPPCCNRLLLPFKIPFSIQVENRTNDTLPIHADLVIWREETVRIASLDPVTWLHGMVTQQQ